MVSGAGGGTGGAAVVTGGAAVLAGRAADVIDCVVARLLLVPLLVLLAAAVLVGTIFCTDNEGVEIVVAVPTELNVSC